MSTTPRKVKDEPGTPQSFSYVINTPVKLDFELYSIYLLCLFFYVRFDFYNFCIWIYAWHTTEMD